MTTSTGPPVLYATCKDIILVFSCYNQDMTFIEGYYNLICLLLLFLSLNNYYPKKTVIVKSECCKKGGRQVCIYIFLHIYFGYVFLHIKLDFEGVQYKFFSVVLGFACSICRLKTILFGYIIKRFAVISERKIFFYKYQCLPRTFVPV